MKVVRLSAQRTGYITGSHFCYRLRQPQFHSAARRIMSMTSSGIERETFRLVAQCLDQLCYGVHPLSYQDRVDFLSLRPYAALNFHFEGHNVKKKISKFKGQNHRLYHHCAAPAVRHEALSNNLDFYIKS